MSNEMLRIAGVNPDNVARPFKLNKNGELKVELTGTPNQLFRHSPSFNVPAGETFSVTFPVAENVDSTNARNVFDRFEVSWYSDNGLGGVGTSLDVYHHRLPADLTYNSITYRKKLGLQEGIKQGDDYTFFVSHDDAQTIKNRYVTLIFTNTTAGNMGALGLTVILK